MRSDSEVKDSEIDDGKAIDDEVRDN